MLKIQKKNVCYKENVESMDNKYITLNYGMEKELLHRKILYILPKRQF